MGQQVGQLHERYMIMMKNHIIKLTKNIYIKTIYIYIYIYKPISPQDVTCVRQERAAKFV